MPIPSHVQLGCSTQLIANGAAWRNKDDFPASQAWADEVEEVLTHLKVHGQFDRFLPRLRASITERDEALAEGRVSFFLSNLGFAITAWEPIVVPNIPGEYEIQLTGSQAIFVEVKSPGWEGELTEEEKRGARKFNPKYINAEFRSYNAEERVLYAAKKAMSKFANDRPNLLVVADDLFVSPLYTPIEILDHRIRSGLDRKEHENLGAVLLFVAEQRGGKAPIKYFSRLIENPRSGGQVWALPPAATQVLTDAQALPFSS